MDPEDLPKSVIKSKSLIVIVGPTAIGKTTLAIKLAQHFNTEIISADSRQFFKEMEIGTAKPDQRDLSLAKHHFINSHSVKDLFSTGDFEVEALTVLSEIFEDHEVAIMVGGSGLYVNALINGLDAVPDVNLTIRQNLNQLFAEQGIEPIRKQLAEVDPEYFHKVDQNNPQRMIRGLEVFLSTGKMLSSMLSSTKKERSFNIIKIALNTERSVLYNRINSRVDQMMDSGLLQEVESLRTFKGLNALNTVGYSELFDYLEHKLSLESAVTMIKQNTRRFAKRQLTWFRRDDEMTWFEPDQATEIIDFIDKKLKA